MNKLKSLYAKLGAGLTVAALTATRTLAAGTIDVDAVVNPVVDMIKSLLKPAMALVVAIGMVYCIILGVKYAKCEEPQEREKAKNHLKNAIIGFVLIFILMVALVLLTPALEDWVNNTVGTANKVFN